MTLQLPTIITLSPDQYQHTTPSKKGKSKWAKLKQTLKHKLQLAALAIPLARLTTAALIFETGKIAAALIAPELQPWSVTL